MSDILQNDEMTATEDQTQKALLVLNVLLGGAVLIILPYYFIAWQTQSWHMFVLATVLLAFGFLTIFTRRLVKDGRVERGITITIGGMFVIFPVSVLLVADLGSVLSLSLIAISITIILQTLPSSQHARLVIMSVAIGLITYLLDIFGGDYRLTLPQLQSIVTIITALVLLTYAIFIIRGYASYSLRTKLIFAFLTISLISGGVVILLTTNTIRTSLVQDIGENLKSTAETRAVAMGDLLTKQTDLLTTLSLNSTLITELEAINVEASLSELEAIDQQWRNADDNDPLIQNSLNNPLASELNTFQQNFPQHVELFITDEQGALLATTNRTSDYYQADETWWQVAFADGQGGTFISQPEFDESSNALGLQMAVPMFSTNGAIVGILRTTYQADAFSELLSAPLQSADLRLEVYLPNGGELELEDGEVELSEDEGYEQWLDLATSSDIFLQIAHNDVSSIASAVLVQDGENRSAISDLGWVLVSLEPEAVGLAAVNDQQRTTILLVIVVALLSIAAAFIFAQYLTQPVLTLVSAVSQVRAGDFSTRVPVQTQDETGVLGLAFNDMTEQLQKSVGRLERRNRVIETSAAVGRSLSTILEPKQLASAVVDQVQKTFNYYHAHIYFLDSTGQTLEMAGGTGFAGAEMIAAGHTIALGQGLVGRAAATNQLVLASDVTQEADWLPNPLLPETRSETAVPITIGDQVMGVLDVQHNIKNGLRELDAEMLQAVANQVAIALQNARTYAQVQQRAEQEAILNKINQKIETATTIETVLDVTARELRQAFGAQRTVVELTAKRNNGKK